MRLFVVSIGRLKQGPEQELAERYRERFEDVGRKLGFPTANIQLKRKRAALAGVFAVTVSGLDKRHLPGAASLGVRPTLGAGLRSVLEVHLLDFDRVIYGSHVTVHFLHKLRDEAKVL